MWINGTKLLRYRGNKEYFSKIIQNFLRAYCFVILMPSALTYKTHARIIKISIPICVAAAIFCVNLLESYLLAVFVA